MTVKPKTSRTLTIISVIAAIGIVYYLLAHPDMRVTVTEEEAKNKWCPEARVGVYAGNGGVSVNRNPETEDEIRCIGSACMMWRWLRSVDEESLQKDILLELYTKDADAMRVLGYCGKAGRP
jgi:hypothetical protein